MLRIAGKAVGCATRTEKTDDGGLGFSRFRYCRAPRHNLTTREAMDYAAAGVQPPKEERSIEPPDELVEALAAAELAEVCHTLPPDRQRSYVIHLNSAKKAATRINRIGKCYAQILAARVPTSNKHGSLSQLHRSSVFLVFNPGSFGIDWPWRSSGPVAALLAVVWGLFF